MNEIENGSLSQKYEPSRKLPINTGYNGERKYVSWFDSNTSFSPTHSHHLENISLTSPPTLSFPYTQSTEKSSLFHSALKSDSLENLNHEDREKKDSTPNCVQKAANSVVEKGTDLPSTLTKRCLFDNALQPFLDSTCIQWWYLMIIDQKFHDYIRRRITRLMRLEHARSTSLSLAQHIWLPAWAEGWDPRSLRNAMPPLRDTINYLVPFPPPGYILKYPHHTLLLNRPSSQDLEFSDKNWHIYVSHVRSRNLASNSSNQGKHYALAEWIGTLTPSLLFLRYKQLVTSLVEYEAEHDTSSLRVHQNFPAFTIGLSSYFSMVVKHRKHNNSVSPIHSSGNIDNCAIEETKCMTPLKGKSYLFSPAGKHKPLDSIPFSTSRAAITDKSLHINRKKIKKEENRKITDIRASRLLNNSGIITRKEFSDLIRLNSIIDLNTLQVEKDILPQIDHAFSTTPDIVLPNQLYHSALFHGDALPQNSEICFSSKFTPDPTLRSSEMMANNNAILTPHKPLLRDSVKSSIDTCPLNGFYSKDLFEKIIPELWHSSTYRLALWRCFRKLPRKNGEIDEVGFEIFLSSLLDLFAPSFSTFQNLEIIREEWHYRGIMQFTLDFSVFFHYFFRFPLLLLDSRDLNVHNVTKFWDIVYISFWNVSSFKEQLCLEHDKDYFTSMIHNMNDTENQFSTFDSYKSNILKLLRIIHYLSEFISITLTNDILTAESHRIFDCTSFDDFLVLFFPFHEGISGGPLSGKINATPISHNSSIMLPLSSSSEYPEKSKEIQKSDDFCYADEAEKFSIFIEEYILLLFPFGPPKSRNIASNTRDSYFSYISRNETDHNSFLFQKILPRILCGFPVEDSYYQMKILGFLDYDLKFFSLAVKWLRHQFTTKLDSPYSSSSAVNEESEQHLISKVLTKKNLHSGSFRTVSGVDILQNIPNDINYNEISEEMNSVEQLLQTVTKTIHPVITENLDFPHISHKSLNHKNQVIPHSIKKKSMEKETICNDNDEYYTELRNQYSANNITQEKRLENQMLRQIKNDRAKKLVLFPSLIKTDIFLNSERDSQSMVKINGSSYPFISKADSKKTELLEHHHFLPNQEIEIRDSPIERWNHFPLKSKRKIHNSLPSLIPSLSSTFNTNNSDNNSYFEIENELHIGDRASIPIPTFITKPVKMLARNSVKK